MNDEPTVPAALTALHDEVDVRAEALGRRHASRMTCHRGCSSCCQDDLTVFEVEADRIHAHHPELLEDGVPHALGACAFLDGQGGCRVYAHRPFVCRTQGLPLRAFFEDSEGELCEQRDICPLNAKGPSLEQLDEEAFWTLGEVEWELASLQARTNRPDARIRLRDLFRRSTDG